MELGLSYRAVYDLTQPYLNNGYKLYTDNFYTSPKLAKDLLVDGTYLTGTVRTNRKGFPKDLVGEKLDKNVSVFLHCDGITAVHWKDKRDVFCLSSLHGNERETVKRQMTQKKFRLQLAYSLTEAEISKRANPPDDAVLRGPGRPPTPIPRLHGKHFAYNSHIRHRCRVCAKQKNPVTGKYKDTKTVTQCDKCGVHLCIGDCFELWHTNANV